MRLAGGRRIWRRWLSAAGPWQLWSVCPVLLSPELEEIAPRFDARTNARAATLATRLAAELSRSRGTLVLVDLEPSLGVRVAARLSAASVAHPVLVLPRWPYTRGILQVEPLLGAVIDGARELAAHRTRLPHVVFVLDAERGAPVPGRSQHDARADNRHRLQVADLPTLATLRARNIERVVKLACT